MYLTLGLSASLLYMYRLFCLFFPPSLLSLSLMIITPLLQIMILLIPVALEKRRRFCYWLIHADHTITLKWKNIIVNYVYECDWLERENLAHSVVIHYIVYLLFWDTYIKISDNFFFLFIEFYTYYVRDTVRINMKIDINVLHLDILFRWLKFSVLLS